jgi:hypothetical protein
MGWRSIWVSNRSSRPKQFDISFAENERRVLTEAFRIGAIDTPPENCEHLVMSHHSSEFIQVFTEGR